MLIALGKKIRFILPYIFALLNLLGWELVLIQPALFYPVAGALAGLLLLVIFIVILPNFSPQYFIAPIIFLLGGFILLVILRELYLYHIFLLAFCLALLLFLRGLYFFWHDKEKYPTSFLENMSDFLGLTAVFFIASGAYSLFIFLTIPLYIILPGLLLIVGLLLFNFYWLYRIEFGRSWRYIVIGLLILGESSLVLSFLPTNFYVSGIILTLGYYLFTGLSRRSLLGSLGRETVRNYVLTSSIIIILVLGTAQWL